MSPRSAASGGWLLLPEGDAARVTRWTLYEKDDARLGDEPSTTIAASIERVRRDNVPELEPGMVVQLHDLCEAELESGKLLAPVEDRIVELRDSLDVLLGREGTRSRARSALETWKRSRSLHDLERLRGAYEAVPHHMRWYLSGDRINADREYRSALFGEQ